MGRAILTRVIYACLASYVVTFLVYRILPAEGKVTYHRHHFPELEQIDLVCQSPVSTVSYLWGSRSNVQ